MRVFLGSARALVGWVILGSLVFGQEPVRSIAAEDLGDGIALRVTLATGSHALTGVVLLALEQDVPLRLTKTAAATLGDVASVDVSLSGESLGQLPLAPLLDHQGDIVRRFGGRCAPLPVLGLLGADAFRGRAVTLDLSARVLRFDAIDGAVATPRTPGDGLAVRVASSSTPWRLESLDSLSRAAAPSGSPRMLGPFDVRRFGSWAPSPTGETFVALGVLRRVQLGLRASATAVQWSVSSAFDDASELTLSSALRRGDADALERALVLTSPSPDAATAASTLITLRCQARDVAPIAVARAVVLRGDLAEDGHRARTLLEEIERLLGLRPDLTGIVGEDLLLLAMQRARTEGATHDLFVARARFGAALRRRGALDEAWRHLLSAAFGLPEDGEVNLELGFLYRERGKIARAIPRWLRAALRPETFEAAVAALASAGVVTNVAGEDPLGLVEAWGDLVPTFVPAKPWTPPATGHPVLIEGFVGAHVDGAAGAMLALPAFEQNVASAGAIVLLHYASLRTPDGATVNSSLARGAELSVRALPSVRLNGQPSEVRSGSAAEAGAVFEALRAPVTERASSLGPGLGLEAEWTVGDHGTLEVRVSVGAEVQKGARLRLWVRDALRVLPANTGVTLHRFVARGEIPVGSRLPTPTVPLEVRTTLDAVDLATAPSPATGGGLSVPRRYGPLSGLSLVVMVTRRDQVLDVTLAQEKGAR